MRWDLEGEPFSWRATFFDLANPLQRAGAVAVVFTSDVSNDSGLFVVAIAPRVADALRCLLWLTALPCSLYRDSLCWTSTHFQFSRQRRAGAGQLKGQSAKARNPVPAYAGTRLIRLQTV